MTDNANYIISICKRLKTKGIEPSVALIRSKANRTLAIPQVIQVLKSWKQDPEQFSHVVIDDSNESSSPMERTLEQRVAYLEQQMTKLTDKVDRLSQLK